MQLLAERAPASARALTWALTIYRARLSGCAADEMKECYGLFPLFIHGKASRASEGNGILDCHILLQAVEGLPNQ